MAGKEGNIKVSIQGIKKIYKTRTGENIALNGVDFDIKENEFICVIGPSGCGKSTLLNIIAGLLEPTSGEVYVDGNKVQGTGTDRGVVFQQYALFPWLTVRKNVEFGLKLKGMDKEQRKTIVDKYLKMVELEKFADAYPKELSGGMKQRVAIARAYAMNPSVLLMDEPFGALDEITRKMMQKELLALHKKLGLTVVFITHDIREAMKLGDRVLVMDQGRAVQLDRPEVILSHPANAFVQELISD